jgi:predicted TIM-barrel fold metal-dependent hydrolase
MVSALGFGQMIRQGQSLSGELVIDAHAHLGLMKDYHVPRPEAADLVAYMNRYGIGTACIFAFAGVTSDFVHGNDLVVAAVRDFPARFIGYTTLNANYPHELTPELERCDRLGLRGIKLITAYQGHSEETERFFPVYEWANSRRKIILSHQWGSADFLGRMAAQHPQICFVIGHLNLAYAGVVRKYDNVFTTTTFVPWPGAIAGAVKAFGAAKILFGSDFPDLDTSLNIGPLLTAQISDEDKRMILGRNMRGILDRYG